MENQVMKFGKILLFLVKKEKRLMKLVLKKNPILFPKEGVFIGFEWIMNEENSYTKKVTYDKKNSKNETFINPEIYYQKSEKNELYVKIKSMWMKINQKEKYNHLSIEIDLTD